MMVILLIVFIYKKEKNNRTIERCVRNSDAHKFNYVNANIVYIFFSRSIGNCLFFCRSIEYRIENVQNLILFTHLKCTYALHSLVTHKQHTTSPMQNRLNSNLSNGGNTKRPK